jgi:hypothetical protein
MQKSTIQHQDGQEVVILCKNIIALFKSKNITTIKLAWEKINFEHYPNEKKQ